MSGEIYVPEELGRLIREIYVREFRMFANSQSYGESPIPRWDGGRDRSGRSYQPIWPKLAAFFIDNHIDPELMVQTLFRSWTRSDPPTPAQLEGPHALELYRVESKNMVTQLKVRFESDYSRLERHIALITPRNRGEGHTDEEIVREALMDHLRVEVSDIFRYCIAKAAHMEDVAALYSRGALQGYLFRRRAYDEAWGESIPEELKRAADAAISRTQH